jgi:hypothetical protein
MHGKACLTVPYRLISSYSCKSYTTVTWQSGISLIFLVIWICSSIIIIKKCLLNQSAAFIKSKKRVMLDVDAKVKVTEVSKEKNLRVK